MEDSKSAPVDIDRLKKMPTGSATVNGSVHLVLQPTGRIVQRVSTADAGSSTLRLYEAVAQCVPTLTADEVADLTVNEVTALWAIACGGIEAAKAMFPNVYGPGADQTSQG